MAASPVLHGAVWVTPPSLPWGVGCGPPGEGTHNTLGEAGQAGRAPGGPRLSSGPGIATREGLVGVGAVKGLGVERVGSVQGSLGA